MNSGSLHAWCNICHQAQWSSGCIAYNFLAYLKKGSICSSFAHCGLIFPIFPIQICLHWTHLHWRFQLYAFWNMFLRAFGWIMTYLYGFGVFVLGTNNSEELIYLVDEGQPCQNLMMVSLLDCERCSMRRSFCYPKFTCGECRGTPESAVKNQTNHFFHVSLWNDKTLMFSTNCFHRHFCFAWILLSPFAIEHLIVSYVYLLVQPSHFCSGGRRCQ